MSRSPLRAGWFCLMAAIMLASPAVGADLPLFKPLFIRCDPNRRDLEIDPATAANLPIAKLQLRDNNVGANITQWTLLPSGQKGKVQIFQPKANVVLDTEPSANDNDLARIKVSPATANPTPSQQWRIFEVPNGTFAIMNVQSGLVLDADSGTLNSADGITTVLLKHRDGSAPNRQWRFIPAQPKFTTKDPDKPPANAQAPRKKLEPVLEPLVIAAGPGDFKGADVTVLGEVTLIGAGTNELTAQVEMTVTGSNGRKLKGTQFYRLLTVTKGRKIYLDPNQRLAEKFTYSAGPMQTDKGTGPKAVTGFPNPVAVSLASATFPAAGGNPNPIDRLISFASCVTDPTLPDGNPFSLPAPIPLILVGLESLQVFVDLPE